MTEPPPYLASGGNAAAQTTEFGATTVSGTPTTNGQAGAPGRPTAYPPGAPAPGGGPGGPSYGGAPYGGPLGGSLGGPPSLAGATPPPGPDSLRAAAARPPRVRGPRRARLQLRHINPWTVLKFSCVLSIALFFIWLIVIAILYGVLDASGVISKVNNTVTTINGPGSKKPITGGIVLGGAAIVGVINVILFIALTTVGSVIYNLCADLVGGVELTLSEA